MNPKESQNHSEPSAFKAAQTRHRRRGDDPERIDDLPYLVDFSNPNENSQIISFPSNGSASYSCSCDCSSCAPSSMGESCCTENRSNTSQNHTLCSGQVDDSRTRSDCRKHEGVRTDDAYQGPLYGLQSAPGFVYAPQALSKSLQTDLAYLALSDYCERPHVTNIDLVPLKEGVEENNADESMWELWKSENRCLIENPGDGRDEGRGGRNCVEGGERSVKEKGSLPRSPKKKSRTGKEGNSKRRKRKYRSFNKLSWSTMGYHYDWTARAYREDAKSPLPETLASLCRQFALASLATQDFLEGQELREKRSGDANNRNYTPSACIVNYYHVKSVMRGHRDDLELAFDKPVVSISLGLPAVFLLGGLTKDAEPIIPILVRPGDVMMLGGESRLRYHGMARVIPYEVRLAPVCDDVAGRCLDFEVPSWNGEDVISDSALRSSLDVATKACGDSSFDAGDSQSIRTGITATEGDCKYDRTVTRVKRDRVKGGHRRSCTQIETSETSRGPNKAVGTLTPDSDLCPVETFLNKHRINIIVRQVLPDGVKCLPDEVYLIPAER